MVYQNPILMQLDEHYLDSLNVNLVLIYPCDAWGHFISKQFRCFQSLYLAPGLLDLNQSPMIHDYRCTVKFTFQTEIDPLEAKNGKTFRRSHPEKSKRRIEAKTQLSCQFGFETSNSGLKLRRALFKQPRGRQWSIILSIWNMMIVRQFVIHLLIHNNSQYVKAYIQI
jgi:hypothetical protein